MKIGCADVHALGRSNDDVLIQGRLTPGYPQLDQFRDEQALERVAQPIAGRAHLAVTYMIEGTAPEKVTPDTPGKRRTQLRARSDCEVSFEEDDHGLVAFVGGRHPGHMMNDYTAET